RPTVADLGSPEWAEEAGPAWSRLPPAPGAEGSVSLGVAVAPRRETAIHWRYQDGQVVEGGPGPNPGESSLSLTLALADAAEVFAGSVPPSVAFMRGRLKASGDGRLLLAFLRSTTEDGFEDWRAQLV
ncbi:MAG TPA: SCP2 sterol-binding domain-containing protein, partial [Acidimicrobiales bacterium]|nr:SCP2 sterol-binding domain-containing protein [Acidimicrobiales bacterium]